MDTPEQALAEGKAATERIEQRTQRVTEAGGDGAQRWGWVRVFAVVSIIGLTAAVTLGVIGYRTTSDTRDAVKTSEFSENQRGRRLLQSECKSGYQIEGDLARDVADQAQVKFNKAILGYLAYGIGTLADAAALQQEQDIALLKLEAAKQNLEAVKDGDLCSAEEYGVVVPKR